MELARLEQHVPPCHTGAVGAAEIASKDVHASSVEEPEDGPHDELGVLEANEGDNGLGKSGQEDGADKGAGDGAGEGEVVVGGGEPVMDVGGRGAVNENIVGGLHVEGLLDLGVGGDDEVQEDEGGDQEGEEGV